MPRRRKIAQSIVEPTIQTKQLKPLNEEQSYLIDIIKNNDIILLKGRAGSGKSYISAGMAAQDLISGRVDKIIISRPIIGAEKDFGILPGDIGCKIQPFLDPILKELGYFLNTKKYIAEEKIEILPVSFMRGHTFKNSFVIVDEAENLTEKQLKLVVTRFGYGSKLIINGDVSQSDLNGAASYDFEKVIRILNKELYRNNRVATFELFKSVRHPLIDLILSEWV